MFIRWKKRLRSTKKTTVLVRIDGMAGFPPDRPRYAYTSRPVTDEEKTLHIAYLCISRRIDGKPRQATHYLASIRGGHLGARIHFWATALRNLEKLALDPGQQETILMKLAEQVAIPTKELVEKEKQSMLAFWDKMSVQDEDYLLEKLPV